MGLPSNMGTYCWQVPCMHPHPTAVPLLLTWRWGDLTVPELDGDAELVVRGKLATVQHLGPGEAVGLHDGGAGVTHHLAEGAAGVDGPVEADRGEEGAEEELGVGVALLGEQGHPAAGLLLGLGHGLMLQQVGQPHALVAHVATELHVGRDVEALRLPPVEAPVGQALGLPAVVVVVLPAAGAPRQRERQGQQRRAPDPRGAARPPHRRRPPAAAAGRACRAGRDGTGARSGALPPALGASHARSPF